MFVFNDESTRRILTPWGKEVSKRLIDKNMRQCDLVKALQKAGFKVSKTNISNLMYGVGTTNRAAEIKEINRILGIE